MVSKVLFSSKSDNWSTPQDLFDLLNVFYDFNLDPCALPENAKCVNYFTPEQDGLSQSWYGYRVFCNPPYSQLAAWVKKAFEESRKGTKIIMLLPARTDTKWFHEYVYNGISSISFLRGRLKFGNSKHSAPFPSMLVKYNF